MGVLLMIDMYALRAREPAYLLAFYDGLDDRKNLRLLPNMAFSRALATYSVGREADATAMLVDAIVQFPAALAALADACKVALPSRFLRHPSVAAYGRRTEPVRPRNRT